MEKLPLELLLEIAKYCEFEDLCQLARANLTWNDAIGTNWHRLKKREIKLVAICERRGIKSLTCVTPTKRIDLEVDHGSEHLDATNIMKSRWKYPIGIQCRCRTLPYFGISRDCQLKTVDVDRFIGDLFSPIFMKSSIKQLQLNSLPCGSMQTIADLLNQFRTPIGVINITFAGENIAYRIHHDVRVLSDCARIIKIAKPATLILHLTPQFSNSDIQELLLKMIVNMHIGGIIIDWTNCEKFRAEEHSEVEYADKNPITPLQGPLPICEILTCRGDQYNGVSPLTIPTIVDLIEEWSRNERDIVDYELRYFSEKIKHVAAEFEHQLSMRRLGIRVEVVKKNVEFVITKLTPRGDEQDQLQLLFQLDSYLFSTSPDGSDEESSINEEDESEDNLIYIRPTTNNDSTSSDDSLSEEI